MEVASFAEIEAEFMKRVQAHIWCNLATVDRHNRVRSRVVHPIWEHETGWITTRRGSHKGKHLANNPYVSLSYVDAAKPAYADCTAVWADDLSDKQHVWELCQALPPPLGFDPTPIYKCPDHPDFGL